MVQQQEQQQAQPPRRLFTIEQFAQRHAWTSEGALRAQRFDSRNGDRLGFAAAGAFVEIGRKVLIDEERYFSAITSLNKGEDKAAVNGRRPRGRVGGRQHG